MLRNYLLIAIRNLYKHKTFSFINVMGLTAGITCCLLIFIFVKDELSFDKFQSKADRIYRVQYMVQEFNIGQIPPIFNEYFGDYFPEIEQSARLYSRGVSIQVPQQGAAPKRFEEDQVFFADSSVFQIFDFEWIEKPTSEPLSTPLTVVLNRELKEKYFGEEIATGQSIELEGKPFKVIGVAEDFPSNSHLHFDMLVPFYDQVIIEPEGLADLLRRIIKENWVFSHSSTYVLLKEGQSAASVNARFPDFVEEKIPEDMQISQAFKLQPLLSIHMDEEVSGVNDNPGSQTFIKVFITVGILTLLIACINFINLSTARSLQRTKEIGVRKVLGAWKRDLVMQFMGESFVTTAAATVLGFIAAFFMVGVLNRMTGKELGVEVFYQWETWIMIVVLFVVTSFLAGLYPAFFVTRISPVESVKGMVAKNDKSGFAFRNVLMVIQFAISIILISSTLLVFDQLDFIKNKPLGFQKDHMINVPVQSQNMNNIFGGINEQKRQQMKAFEDDIAKIPGVRASTLSANVPGGGVVNRGVVPEGFTPEDKLIAPVLSVDYDFLETYDIELVAGRSFDESFGTDHMEAFIINEQGVKEYNLGSNEEAIGKSMEVEGKKGKIVGVIRDFNFETLNRPITSLVLNINPGQFGFFSISIHNQNIPETLSAIEAKWNEHFPSETFSHTFLNAQLNDAYEAQDRFGRMVGNFSILAILISCLGSYGLIIFVAGQKMKEVGIRKVLGASVTSLVMMLSRRFMVLILIAVLIAVPVAYWFAGVWLEEFSYRVDIAPINYLWASLATMVLVFGTIAFQSIKTAVSNPVKSLRIE
ncbi:ABC transporter permease [Reichenbachiella ulvae]|uniref:ABC transporter permease n=1 Tax=Reichenbachiella ulvae TaxID=2980104 RepID=A0ABT3CX54_9BACT|nr:ABC transporter permease [Reichenbachiella ulvae]MCV9388278.1 ABC transporter permease [Reichenbachiella ulvae]